MVTGSPYGAIDQVSADIPAIEEADTNKVTRYNTESSTEIDDILKRFTTVPLTGTIPQSVVTGCNERIKSKYFADVGEIDKAKFWLDRSDQTITNYGLSISKNNLQTGGDVVVIESDYLSSELAGQ